MSLLWELYSSALSPSLCKGAAAYHLTRGFALVTAAASLLAVACRLVESFAVVPAPLLGALQ